MAELIDTEGDLLFVGVKLRQREITLRPVDRAASSYPVVEKARTRYLCKHYRQLQGVYGHVTELTPDEYMT